MTFTKPLFYFFLVVIIASSCSGNSKKENPEKELVSLKESLKKTNERIKELEKIITDSDTSSLSKVSKAKKVILDTLQFKLFKHYIEAQGTVDADLNVLAAPQMAGVVQSIFVKEGDFVKAGQTLAKLDASTIRQGIEEVKTGLAMANTMFEKQKSLWEQNIGSEAQYLLAKNQKEQLEKKILTLNSQYDMAFIKSPVSGTIDDIKVKIGEIAAPGFNGIRVVNNSKLKVKAKLSDVYASKVKKGDKVFIYFPDLNKEISTTLSFASEAVNISSRTILVEAILPSSKEFKANQAAKIRINDSNINNAILINSNLIQRSINGEDYILVAEQRNNLFYAKKKIVATGSNYDGFTVIEKGLSKGELIISTGYNELVDGQMIQP